MGTSVEFGYILIENDDEERERVEEKRGQEGDGRRGTG